MNTEKIIASKTIYKGKIVDLVINDVVLPNNEISKREIVLHQSGVCVIAIVDENLLLVKQFRSGIGKPLLELPAGLVEDGENLEFAARRELQEEIGYDANKLELLCSFYPSPGFCNEITYIYLASDLYKKELPKDDDEFIEVIKVPLCDINKLLTNSSTLDAKTALGISLFLLKTN